MKEATKRKSPQTSGNHPGRKRKVSSDNIRVRAYEFYIERGQEPGREVEDWLRAERELMKLMN